MRIIDCHVHHLHDTDIPWARELGYDKVCLMDYDLKALMKAARAHPDFVIPLAYLPLQEGKKRIMDTVKRARDAGCMGFKACGASARYDDESYMPVWAKANEYRMPVFFHTGWLDMRLGASTFCLTKRSLADYYHPIALDRIAYENPDLPLVAFHMGGAWRAHCALLMHQYPNIYADSCFGATRRQAHEFLWGQIGGAGTGYQVMAKMVYGTDGMGSRQATADRIRDWTDVLDALRVPVGVRERIWYKNALHILGLDDELKKVVRVPRVKGKAVDLAKAAPAAAAGGYATVSDFTEHAIERLGEPGPVRTGALLGYDDKALRIVFWCEDPRSSDLVASADGPVDNIWQDDCVEVFLSPKRDGKYLHVVANAAARAGVHRGRTDIVEHPEIVAGSVTPTGWWVALTIPWKLIGASPKKGDTWGLQLCRSKQTHPRGAVTWMGVVTTFHDPASFGKMVFE